MHFNRLAIPTVAVVALLALTCGEEESKYPTVPGLASGTTDASGEVDLDLGSHLITVKTVNEASGAISGMNVTVYLLKDFVMVFAAGNDSYYPNVKYVSYADLQTKDETVFLPRSASPQAPQEVLTVEAVIEIILVGVTREICSYYQEPENNEAPLTDPWTTPNTFLGSLRDVFALADSVNNQGGLLVHITSNVAAMTNAEVQTIALPIAGIPNDTMFSVLLGLEFHIFDGDTLNINYMSYGDSLLPVIFIDGVILVQGGFFAQFTLTWDENPSDLDSHLWTPLIGGIIHHIAYFNRGSLASPPYAYLDVDDVTSWGPEHVVIAQPFAGTYTYAVHHYAGTSDIPHSGAAVSILKPDRTVVRYTPPDTTAQADWYWHVCYLDGTTGGITPINVISPNEPIPPGPARTPESLPAKAY